MEDTSIESSEENTESTEVTETPEAAVETPIESVEAPLESAEAPAESLETLPEPEALAAVEENTTIEDEILAAPPVVEEAVVPKAPVLAEQLASAVEAILFSADRPVTVERLREVFGEEGPSVEAFTDVLKQVKEKFDAAAFGFELREAQGGYQFTTRTSNAEFVRRFLQTKPFKVGRSALETLSIIAYRQPVTRAEIDEVRGIDSSHLLRTLIERGLVKMAGKAEIPGRPVQYATTQKFLETIGLRSISELPPLTELEQLEGHTAVDDREARLEAGLNKFIETSSQEAVKVEEENQAEFQQIHSLLDQVQNADREIYESQAHQEVAEANKEAIEAFQATTPKRRRKSAQTQEVRFEDLVASEDAPPPDTEPPPSNA